MSSELFAIIVHWILDPEVAARARIQRGSRTSWFNDNTPLRDLYEDREPEPGSYITVDDARRKIRTLPYFSHATLKPKAYVGWIIRIKFRAS